MPRDEHWLFDKFKFKLDLFTIGKILIKLIIFKKIVKFIALICLLLFLPRLQTKPLNLVDMLAGSDESEEEEVNEKRSFALRKLKITFSGDDFDWKKRKILDFVTLVIIILLFIALQQQFFSI